MDKLTEDEISVINESLLAAAKGPFFPDSDFHIIFGLERDELFEAVGKCNDVTSHDRSCIYAIRSSLNNLLGYPHHCENVWEKYISASPEELERIFNKWKNIISS